MPTAFLHHIAHNSPLLGHCSPHSLHWAACRAPHRGAEKLLKGEKRRKGLLFSTLYRSFISGEMGPSAGVRAQVGSARLRWVHSSCRKPVNKRSGHFPGNTILKRKQDQNMGEGNALPLWSQRFLVADFSCSVTARMQNRSLHREGIFPFPSHTSFTTYCSDLPTSV